MGRRVSLADPPAEPDAAQATFAIPHGGGKRFATDSLEYRVIAEWIAAGTPPPPPDDAQVTRSGSLSGGGHPEARQPSSNSWCAPSIPTATCEDVTRWVKFSSSNEGVATVDDFGHVKMTGSGEAAITLWYSSRVLYSRLTRALSEYRSTPASTKVPRNNFIDELVLAKLKSLHIAPSKIAD